jgi:hypothetical protein
MSTSCGTCGAYGILLSEVELPAVTEIRTRLDEIEELFALAANISDSADSVEDVPEVQALLEPLKKAFREAGITVPDGAVLQWTGSDDDRPARCETVAKQWILGFGLFTRPDMYPPMDLSFIEQSRWHTWVWMG